MAQVRDADKPAKSICKPHGVILLVHTLTMPRIPPGLIVHFDESQRADLIRVSIEGGYEDFSDALSVRDWRFGQVGIALLSFSGSTIDYAALARRTKRVVTHKSRVNLTELIDLNALPFSSVESRLGEQLRRYFIKSSMGTGSTLPDKTWTAVLEIIKGERPDRSTDIDRLITLGGFAGYRLTGPRAEALLLQREALGAALDIFGGANKLRDSVLRSWAPPPESVSNVNDDERAAELIAAGDSAPSFLAGIAQRYVLEESAIQHDLFNWPGASAVHLAGVSTFTKGSRRLDVIYTNNNKLENTLGVDLIYFNKAFDSFVLVQYKLMRKEHDSFTYRPDSQLGNELARMDEFYKHYPPGGEITSHEAFRLHNDGFLFKLVPNIGLQPASGELIAGMYLPREYMRFLLGPNGPKGERGGSLITFGNAKRYLTNSDFAHGVYAGWIGSNGFQTAALQTLVRQYLVSFWQVRAAR